MAIVEALEPLKLEQYQTTQETATTNALINAFEPLSIYNLRPRIPNESIRIKNEGGRLL